MSTLMSLLHFVLGVLTQCNQAGGKDGHTYLKGGSKIYYMYYDITDCVENLKDWSFKQGYKKQVYEQKAIVCLYNSNKPLEIEILKYSLQKFQTTQNNCVWI